MSMFVSATKEGAYARVAIFGPSGSGKTFSALRIATGMGGSIAVIDTERRSARKYSDRFKFDVCDLEDRSLDGYVKAMDDARAYDLVIIDGLSHAWKELRAEVDKLANAKFRGNTWAAWSEGTPRQNWFIDRMVSLPCHVIATMRSKTEWQTGADNAGRTRPVRVGLAPEQRGGTEYEFDMLLELTPEHIAHVIKDRTGRFQDRLIEKPGEDFGRELVAWLADAGEPPPPVTSPSPPPPIDAGYAKPPDIIQF